jgi:hypothetical protein
MYLFCYFRLFVCMCMLCNGSDHCLLIRRDDGDTIGPGVCLPGLAPPILVEHFVPSKFVFITVVTRHDGELHHGGEPPRLESIAGMRWTTTMPFTWLLSLLVALLAAFMLYFVSDFL